MRMLTTLALAAAVTCGSDVLAAPSSRPIPQDSKSAFSSEFPPIDDPGFQDELTNYLSRIMPGKFPPSEFSDVTRRVFTVSIAPFCYRPSDWRLGYKGLEEATVLHLDVMLEKMRAECRVLVFAGKRGSEIAWLVAYNIPAGASPTVPKGVLTHQNGHHHLTIIPLRALSPDAFDRAARSQAWAQFNRT